MDKLLAMSILSAGPDYSAGNWWLSHLPAGGHLKKKEVKNENEKHTSGNRNEESKENKARFGMEFDGLNCFETLISY
ncbi:hypothetical protein MA16_Dca008951 [Dendrobium catenatum]|uniref:Uncharacterized protein n=1 Tax=Dendrobium catenatum TaxID=906689 RepID=A0A2I0WRP1_9ASPA|nr:hypothetical protein MA16_Dca008951 [Dendrobium catenatum]